MHPTMANYNSNCGYYDDYIGYYSNANVYQQDYCMQPEYEYNKHEYEWVSQLQMQQWENLLTYFVERFTSSFEKWFLCNSCIHMFICIYVYSYACMCTSDIQNADGLKQSYYF